MAIITINNRRFAQTEREFTDALLTPDAGTCIGFWDRSRNGDIRLYDQARTRIGGIRQNRLVYRSSRRSDGRLWHQAATPELVGGLGVSPLQLDNDAKHALAIAAGRERMRRTSTTYAWPTETLAVISTSHLPQNEATRVSGALDDGIVIGLEREKGWMLPTAQRITTSDDTHGLDTLAELLRSAGEDSIDWILFDSDGNAVEGIAQYDW